MTRMDLHPGTPLARIIACLCFIGFPLSSGAQETSADDSTVTYPASYFVEYAPVTAQDMLDRIPGASSGNSRFGGSSRGGFSHGGGGSGGRGFGSGSGENEILINGKRTAGKNNATGGLLDRITAEQVSHIEIIRGTSGELDVRGSGQVFNIVLFEELTQSNISYEVTLEQSNDETFTPGGNLSYSGQSGGLNYLFNLEESGVYRHEVSEESSVLGDFSPNDLVDEDQVTEGSVTTFSTNLGYELGPRSSARFNALYADGGGPPNTVFRATTDLKVTPNTINYQREENPADTENWEIGGDYEFLSNQGNRFKILFISNSFTYESLRERWDLEGDGSESKNLFLDSGNTTKERIARGSYTFDILGNQDIELGAERAQTILDSNLSLATDTAEGIPSPGHGGLIPIDVPNSNSTVEEIRYEPFAIHNWVISPKISLESTLVYETSEISQSGDVSNKRDFDFWKPKVDFRYDLTPTIQIRASIEKVVEQLSFRDFVAAGDSRDNDEETQAGNENLRQEWFWKYDINAQYRLPNDYGVLDGNLYYYDYHDKIERIDVSPSPDDLQSANGNIGDGIEYGINLNASVRMRMIDMPNLLLTGALNVSDSEITDPFLGIERRFTYSERGSLSLGFRHDITRWNMNYGLSYYKTFDGNRKRYDIDDLEISSGDPYASAFVEVIAFGATTFRLDARNFTSADRCRERQRFVGHIADDILEEIEDRCSTSGKTFTLRVSGTF